MKKILSTLLLSISLSPAANAFVMFAHCGPYDVQMIPDSLFKINGQTVTSQRIDDLGEDKTGMRVNMTLMPASDGNSYGFMYMHPAGSNDRWLVVQLLQASMNAPTVTAKYPCTREVRK